MQCEGLTTLNQMSFAWVAMLSLKQTVECDNIMFYLSLHHLALFSMQDGVAHVHHSTRKLSRNVGGGLVRADICAADAECWLSCHPLTDQTEVRAGRGGCRHASCSAWHIIMTMEKCLVCAPRLSVCSHAGYLASEVAILCLCRSWLCCIVRSWCWHC